MGVYYSSNKTSLKSNPNETMFDLMVESHVYDRNVTTALINLDMVEACYEAGIVTVSENYFTEAASETIKNLIQKIKELIAKFVEKAKVFLKQFVDKVKALIAKSSKVVEKYVEAIKEYVKSFSRGGADESIELEYFPVNKANNSTDQKVIDSILDEFNASLAVMYKAASINPDDDFMAIAKTQLEAIKNRFNSVINPSESEKNVLFFGVEKPIASIQLSSEDVTNAVKYRNDFDKEVKLCNTGFNAHVEVFKIKAVAAAEKCNNVKLAAAINTFLSNMTTFMMKVISCFASANVARLTNANRVIYACGAKALASVKQAKKDTKDAAQESAYQDAYISTLVLFSEIYTETALSM